MRLSDFTILILTEELHNANRNQVFISSVFKFCHFRVKILRLSMGSSFYLPRLPKSFKMHGIVLLMSMEGMA